MLNILETLFPMLWNKRWLLLSILITLSAPHSVPSRGGSNFVLQDVSPSTRHQSPAHIKCCNHKAKEVQLLLLEMPAIIMGYTSKLRQSFSSESRGIQLVWEQLFLKGWLALSGEAGNMKEIDGCHWQAQKLPKTKSVLLKQISFHKNKSGPLKRNPIWEAMLGALEPCQMLRCPRCLITPIFKKRYSSNCSWWWQ